jgi:hypothetical protein
MATRFSMGDAPYEAERDGVYTPPKANSAAANAERDGVYTPPKANSAAANAERDGKRIVPKAITDKVKSLGFTPGTSDFEEAERQFERTRKLTPIGSAGSGGSKYAKGGSVSASRRADGIAQRGKTKGRMC